MKKRCCTIWLAAIYAASSMSAEAATATGTFAVRLNIVASCNIGALSDIDFGSTSTVTTALDQTSSIQINCSLGAPFLLGLDTGANGLSVSDRKMKNAAGNTIAYQLYRDAGRTQVWGATAGVDVLSLTGTGASQTMSIYSRVAPQAGLAVGAYSDVVTVTVTY